MVQLESTVPQDPTSTEAGHTLNSNVVKPIPRDQQQPWQKRTEINVNADISHIETSKDSFSPVSVP